MLNKRKRDSDMSEFLRSNTGQLYALYKACGGKEGVSKILQGKQTAIPTALDPKVICSGRLIIGHQVRRSFYNTFGEHWERTDYEEWAREIMENPPEQHGVITMDFCSASFEDITSLKEGLLEPEEFRKYIQSPYIPVPYEVIPQIFAHLLDAGEGFPELHVVAERGDFAFPCSTRDYDGRRYSHCGVELWGPKPRHDVFETDPSGMRMVQSTNPRHSSSNQYLLARRSKDSSLERCEVKLV